MTSSTTQIEEQTNDKVGYKGDDPGEPAVVPAWQHRRLQAGRTFSSAQRTNMTDKYRRSYLAQ